MEETISPIVKTAERISEIVKRVRVNKDRAKGDVDKTFRQISDVIEKRRLKLIQEIENSAIARSTLLEKQKEGLDKVSTSLQLALESGSAACKEYSSAEILAVKGTVLLASKGFLEELRSLDLKPVSINSSLSLNTDDTEKEHIIESVSLFGSIVVLCPPLCGLIGINPQLAIGVAKGSERVVILQTRDEKGENLIEGTAKVLAKVTNPSSGSEVSECIVTDLDNGRYEIQFTNPTKGQYMLNITIDEDHISNSPFTVNVRDYTAIKKPVASVSEHDRVGFAISQENLYYVTGERESMKIYNSDVGVVNDIPQSKLNGKNLRGIAIDDHNGVVFVASAGTNSIVKVTLDDEPLISVGEKGIGESKFNWPMGLCLTRDGLLLVAELNNKRIQVLGPGLSFVRFIPCHSGVYGVSVDCNGNVHAAVTDRIEVFSITGEEKKIGEYGHGILKAATDVAFLPHSNSQYSFVTDCVTEGRVCIFDWSKNELIHIIECGDHPLGLAIDQEGIVVVCGWEDKQLHQF